MASATRSPSSRRSRPRVRRGCSVADWECVRATSYLFTGTPVGNDEARAAEQQGFELGLHLDLGCKDYTPASLEAAWLAQQAQFDPTWDVSALRTLRTHCVTWSDWASEPKAELRHVARRTQRLLVQGPRVRGRAAAVQDRAGRRVARSGGDGAGALRAGPAARAHRGRRCGQHGDAH